MRRSPLLRSQYTRHACVANILKKVKSSAQVGRQTSAPTFHARSVHIWVKRSERRKRRVPFHPCVGSSSLVMVTCSVVVPAQRSRGRKLE